MISLNRNNQYTNYIVPGGYIAQIKTVKHDAGQKLLRIAFDICEGEYKGCFKKEYEENISKGWPKKAAQDFRYGEDLGEKALNSFINNLEASNNFVFNGDELAFKGLKIGVYYKKNTYQANDGTMKQGTSFPKFTSVEKIQKGEYSIEETTSNNATKTDDLFTNDNVKYNVDDDDIAF